jgi:hypothetical protein
MLMLTVMFFRVLVCLVSKSLLQISFEKRALRISTIRQPIISLEKKAGLALMMARVADVVCNGPLIGVICNDITL